MLGILLVITTLEGIVITFDPTPEAFAGAAGIALSLILSYVPGVAPWYNALDGTKKSLVVLGMMALVGVGAFALGCGGLIKTVTCDTVGAWHMLFSFVAALITSQTTHQISPLIGYKRSSIK